MWGASRLLCVYVLIALADDWVALLYRTASRPAGQFRARPLNFFGNLSSIAALRSVLKRSALDLAVSRVQRKLPACESTTSEGVPSPLALKDGALPLLDRPRRLLAHV